MVTSTAPALPSTIDFPSIWCPIPARLHPDAAGIDDHLLDWARRSDLIRTERAAEHFRSAGFGQFTASVQPRAVQLELVAEWQGFNWIVDDQLDEGHLVSHHEERIRLARELVAQMPLDMSAAPRPSGPLAAAMSDLWRRTAGPFSRAWRERFHSHYRDFLAFTILAQSPDRAGRPVPDLEAFMRRRRLQSGCEMSFDLSEVANLSEVPDIVAGSDSYRAVRIAANDVISWTNDIFSIRKESARGDQDHLVAVLRHTKGHTWEEALTESAEMIAELTRDFLDASRDLRAMRSLYDLDDRSWAVVEESLDDLSEWISGNLSWHWWSPRYRDVETTSDGQLPSYIERHLV